MAESAPESQLDVEFDDYLIKLFWTLHRFKCLQWLLLLLIRIREKLDIHKFIKKPITKEVDDMDNCHFRTLYKRNHFNDNYTDPDFLCSMQLNTNLNYYTLGEAISASTRVALQLCPCILYFIIYYHLRQDKIGPETVFGIALISTLLGYGIFQWCHWSKLPSLEAKMTAIWSDIMSSLCCGGFSYLLVPILRTVTQSVDTRTVYAVCAIMFGVHLLCNDYGLKVAIVSSALSMNSAIFSVICLASRLQSDDHCLALMSFGVMSFICYPQWGSSIRSKFHQWNATASLVVVILVTFAGYTISWGTAVFITVLVLMIIVVSPILYVCYVQYKVNILGPWDEARPELHVNMEEIERGFENRRNQRGNSSEESIGGGGRDGGNKRSAVDDGEIKSDSSSAHSIQKRDDEKKIAELEAKGIGLIL